MSAAADPAAAAPDPIPWFAQEGARAWRCAPIPAEVRAFHASLPGYMPTRLVEMPAIARELGVGRVFVKDESARLGLPAFKALGASWAIHRALAERPSAGPVTLVAATDGNHGRAVARTARLLGHRAIIHTAPGIHPAAIAAIEGEGAEVVLGATDYDDAVREAARTADRPGAILVQDMAWEGYEAIPAWIVEGYATLCLEADEQLAAAGAGGPDLVVMPVGVGSLAHAVVTHYRSLPSGTAPALLSVEPVAAGCVLQSLRLGTLTSVPTSHTIMAGLNCGTPSSLGWPTLQAGLDAAVAIDDGACRRAMADMAANGVAAGPCGAAALGGLRAALGGANAADRRAALGLTPDSVVLLLSTEGADANPLGSERHGDGEADPLALLRQLVAIDSVNPGLAATGAGETAIADWSAHWLGDHGFEVHRLERTPGRPSVVGIARGTGGGRSLMLNGHLDTVGIAGYDGDPLAVEIRDGQVHGRGTFDMKGGMAAMLAAAVRARAGGGLRGDLVLALVADEEHASMGTEEVIAAGFRADAAIVCEPTLEELVVAHKGFAWTDVVIEGVAAHGSRPDLGVDAIAKAGHFLVALDAFGARLAAGPAHPVLGTGSIHAGVITGGVEPSTYPATCRISVERRTIPGEDAATVAAELRAILEPIAASVPGFRYRLEPGLARDPWEADPASPAYGAILRQATEALGRPPVIRGERFWTDAQLLEAAGIPSVLFGLDGGGAHAATEWVELASLHRVTDILTAVIGEICA